MDKKPKQRLAYEPPVLKKIDLKAEEVLASGCKTSAGPAAPLGGSCVTNNCSAEGS